MVFYLLMDTVKFPLHWASPLAFKGTNRSSQIIKHLLYYLQFLLNCASVYYFMFLIFSNPKLLKFHDSEGHFQLRYLKGQCLLCWFVVWPVYLIICALFFVAPNSSAWQKKKYSSNSSFWMYCLLFSLSLNKYEVSFTHNILLPGDHISFCGTSY